MQNLEKFLLSKSDVASQLSIVMKDAPKIRAMMALVSEQIIKNEEKMMVFMSLSGQMTFYYAIFKVIDITVAVMHAAPSYEQSSNTLCM